MAYRLSSMKQLLLVVAIAVLVLLLVSRYSPDPYIPSDGSTVRPYWFNTSSRNCSGVSKWVVTTSVAITPSEAVHVILNLTKDWCVLVLGKVAGLKYDFSWTKGTTHLIYLPPEALLLLPYKFTKLTSLNVKNIGYLYAIANGARVVLDLEDGIVPIRVNHTYLPLQADKRVFPCPNLEEKEGRFNDIKLHIYLGGGGEGRVEEVGECGAGGEWRSGGGGGGGIVHEMTMLYNNPTISII